MLSGLTKTLDQALDIASELVIGHQPRPESKTPASSSTAIVIRQSSEMTKAKETVIDQRLPPPLLSIITDYLDESHPYQERYLYTGLFLLNLLRIYERAIVHNLLWHIDIDENLKQVEIYQGCLTKVFNIKDPLDLEIEATLLQIMKAAGDRDTREMKAGEEHFGIFESLVKLFKEFKMQDEYKRQDDAWPLDEKASVETMKTKVEAIEIFCQKVIKNEDKKIPGNEEEVDDAAFEELLKSQVARDFEKALKETRPGYVVRSGFISMIGLYFKFLEIRQKYLSQLGEWSHKDDLFSGKFYLVYQSILQRCDLEIIKKGFYFVVENGAVADHINFAQEGKGAGKVFSGLSSSFFFGGFGDKLTARGVRWGRPRSGGVAQAYKTYIQQKHQPLIYATHASSPTDRLSDKAVLESKSAANTAGR